MTVKSVPWGVFMYALSRSGRIVTKPGMAYAVDSETARSGMLEEFMAVAELRSRALFKLIEDGTVADWARTTESGLWQLDDKLTKAAARLPMEDDHFNLECLKEVLRS